MHKFIQYLLINLRIQSQSFSMTLRSQAFSLPSLFNSCHTPYLWSTQNTLPSLRFLEDTMLFPATEHLHMLFSMLGMFLSLPFNEWIPSCQRTTELKWYFLRDIFFDSSIKIKTPSNDTSRFDIFPAAHCSQFVIT